VVLEFFILGAGRRRKKKKKQQRRERGLSSSFTFGIVIILGSDFVPILGGREGVGFLSPLFFSPLFSPHNSSPLLLPSLTVGSGLVTAIPAVLPCSPRGAHHQVCLHFPIA